VPAKQMGKMHGKETVNRGDGFVSVARASGRLRLFETFVRAIALSISSVPVAAPAPDYDLRRHLMTGSSRARQNAESM
jgi:hypothetical protein